MEIFKKLINFYSLSLLRTGNQSLDHKISGPRNDYVVVEGDVPGD